jgi:hypothetical protein
MPAAVAEAQAGLATQAAVIVGTVKTKSSPLLLSIFAYKYQHQPTEQRKQSRQ